MIPTSMRLAVLVPCFNEEAAIASVIAGFRKALPAAEIYVYDNNSKDRTIALAREAGAVVRSERRQGKGHVVRRMLPMSRPTSTCWSMATPPTMPQARRA